MSSQVHRIHRFIFNHIRKIKGKREHEIRHILYKKCVDEKDPVNGVNPLSIQARSNSN